MPVNRVPASRATLSLLAALLLHACAPTPGPGPGQPPPPAGVREEVRQLQSLDDLVAQQRLGPAESGYRRFIQDHPASPLLAEARFKLAELLLSQGRREEAIPLLEQAAGATASPFGGRAGVRLAELRGVAAMDQAWPELAALLGPQQPQRGAAWGRLVSGYLATTTPEATAPWLRLAPAGGLDPQLARILLAQLAGLGRERLMTLLAWQPEGSWLSPWLQLTLGDAHQRAGNEADARRFWEVAASANALASGGHVQDLVVHEARRRLDPATVDQLPLRVGVLLPMGGRFQALGRNLTQSLQKALADYPDVPLTLLLADSGGDPATAQAALDHLIARRGAEVIVGPVFHAPARATAVMAAHHGIPIITLNPHPDVAVGIAGQVILNAFQPDRQARLMAEHAFHQLNRRRAAVLAPLSDYGQLMGAAFARHFVALGGELAGVTYFTPDTPDFSPWLKALTHLGEEEAKQRWADSRAMPVLDPTDPPPPEKVRELEAWADFDLLFLPARAEDARLVAPQAAFFNIRQPEVALLGSSLWNRPELLASGTDYLNGALFPDSEAIPRESFFAGYRHHWEEEPVTLAMLAYDAVAALAQLRRGERLGGAPWRHALTRPEGFSGSAGPVRFRADGATLRRYQLHQVTAAGIRPLETLLEERDPPPLSALVTPSGGAAPAPGEEEPPPGMAPGQADGEPAPGTATAPAGPAASASDPGTAQGGGAPPTPRQ